MTMEFKKFASVDMRKRGISEASIESLIAAQPELLGLGDDLVLVDRQRQQPGAGRLDLLLQDADQSRRWEVELQLGKTDESHIIRVLEYWDIERKRYPNYEHTAVIIAEDITSRFMNVISLFHGAIPLVAIKMEALEHNGELGLHFTKVLEPIALGSEDEDGVQSATDRAYWENQRGTKATVQIADELADIARAIGIPIELKYNKFYIGITLKGAPELFMIFRPKKTFTRFEPRLPDSESLRKKCEDAGLTLMGYEQRWGRFRIELRPGEVVKNREILTQLIKEAYEVHTAD
jgi:hypothetical protein